MNPSPAIAAALGVLLAAGCDVPSKEAEPSKTQPAQRAVAEASTNAWKRSRECAAQAEKVAVRILSEQRRGPDYAAIVHWENHYSPKHERCYLLLVNQNRRPDREAGIPAIYHELNDAFENRSLASVSAGGKNDSLFCWIQDGVTQSSQDCAAARAYVEERMNK